METQLCFTPALELARLIQLKTISPVEVVEQCIARIEQLNPSLNCFCFVYAEEALERQRACWPSPRRAWRAR